MIYHSFLSRKLLGFCSAATAAAIALSGCNGGNNGPGLPTITPTPVSTSAPGVTSTPVGTPSLTPTPTGVALTGRIAFTSNRDGNLEIYVMNANGTNQRRLTNNAAQDVGPEISPDGSRIVFVSNRDGNFELYSINTDGSGLRRLTRTPAREGRGSFSSDGSEIVFTSGREDADKIFLMNADGSNQRKVADVTDTQMGDDGPSFSPLNNKIVFVTRARNDSRPGRTLFSMNRDGSGRRQVESSGLSAFVTDWAPSSRIVFSSFRVRPYGDIFTINPDGSGLRQLTRSTGTTGFNDPTWSPDARRIAFGSSQGGNVDIYVMNSDGTGHTRITTHSAVDFDPSWGR